MTNIQERLPGAIAPYANALSPEGNMLAAGSGLPAPGGDDSIRRFPRPFPPQAGSENQAGLIQQLLAVIEQLLSALGMGGALNNPSGAQTFFQNAGASSTGDPHLAFNGTGAAGMQQTHFDSMTGHADLLDSDSFAGGYNISTQTTQPGANGITYNERATISSNYGHTQVSLNKDGDAYVMQNGRRFSMIPGRSYDLGNGENVKRNPDGSLEVRNRNASGGSIVTTLAQNGQGVDVRTQAYDVDLGGDLVRGSAQG